MSRLRRLAALGGLLVLVGCDTTVVPTLPAFATSVSAGFHGRNMVFTVSPWPLDSTVAFLCSKQPGSEFTVENPKPAVSAGCVPLETTTSGDVLSAEFAAESLAPDVVGELGRSGPPWYLAVSGARGPFSAATVLTVVDSPIFSPPGPS
jgi:hypothetical protein